MSGAFKVISRSASQPKPDFFARQKLISWWKQETISAARVMVVGAGALGNETIKNLMLLGFGNLLICDFDLVEDSNLSRAVLFRREQSGRPKAEAAAESARALALVEAPKIGWVHGDITASLGLGLFESFDIVLCCLDNIEARIFISRCCLRTGTPWIDSGINELSGHVTSFESKQGACYECGLSSHQFAKGRERYACGEVKRKYHQARAVPTVQVTSSIIAGILTQECLKALCQTGPSFGRRISYQGSCNDLDVNSLARRANCDAHLSLPSIVDLELSSDMALSDVLAAAEAKLGGPVELELNDRLYRGFVARGACSLCEKPIDFYRPIHDLFDVDLFCGDHSPGEISGSQALREPSNVLTRFSLRETQPRILAMSLAEIGVPLAHILTFRTAGGGEHAARVDARLDPMTLRGDGRAIARTPP